MSFYTVAHDYCRGSPLLQGLRDKNSALNITFLFFIFTHIKYQMLVNDKAIGIYVSPALSSVRIYCIPGSVNN